MPPNSACAQEIMRTFGKVDESQMDFPQIIIMDSPKCWNMLGKCMQVKEVLETNMQSRAKPRCERICPVQVDGFKKAVETHLPKDPVGVSHIQMRNLLGRLRYLSRYFNPYQSS